MGRKHGSEKWEAIAGPNVTTSDQLVIRQEMLRSLPVNETWAELEIWGENPISGRLQFVKKDEFEKSEADRKVADAAIVNGREEARRREQERKDREDAGAKKLHDAEVARLNKIHDAAREGFSPMSRAAEKINTRNAREQNELTLAEAEAAEAEKAAERRRTARLILESKSVMELMNEIENLNAQPDRADKITAPRNATKGQLVNLIFAAQGYTLTPEEAAENA